MRDASSSKKGCFVVSETKTKKLVLSLNTGYNQVWCVVKKRKKKRRGAKRRRWFGLGVCPILHPKQEPRAVVVAGNVEVYFDIN
jgi:hypothetical protein